jgi:hypothetical protein
MSTLFKSFPVLSIVSHNNLERHIFVRHGNPDDRPVIPSSVMIMTVIPMVPINMSLGMVFVMPPFGPVVLFVPDRMPFLFVVTVCVARRSVIPFMGK